MTYNVYGGMLNLALSIYLYPPWSKWSDAAVHKGFAMMMVMSVLQLTQVFDTVSISVWG